MACGIGDKPQMILDQLLAQLDDHHSATGPGLIYVNQAAQDGIDQILNGLTNHYPGIDWCGAVGMAIIANESEHASEPAAAVMLLPFEPGSWQMFSGRQPLGQSTDPFHPAAALVHADPTTADLPEIIEQLATRVDKHQLYGGLTAGGAESEMIVHGQRLAGGLTGLAMTEQVQQLSRVTQGCSPLAASHTITECDQQYVISLDSEPALDVLLRDLGVEESIRQSRDGEVLLNALPRRQLQEGLLVGLNRTERDHHASFGDYLVRNLIGIDPQNRMIAIGAHAEQNTELVFCTRDREAARKDLIRICTEIREQVESDSMNILGAHYVSCIARGQALFGSVSAEASLLTHNLPGVPVIGFYANGEIAGNRLYGYTGVLTLFVQAA